MGLEQNLCEEIRRMAKNKIITHCSLIEEIRVNECLF